MGVFVETPLILKLIAILLLDMAFNYTQALPTSYMEIICKNIFMLEATMDACTCVVEVGTLSSHHL